MRPFPVGLDVAGRACLVVGAGAVAARKAAALIDCGADVTIVAPVVGPEAAALHAVVEHRRYVAGEAADYWFVTAATDDRSVNQQVFDDATAAKVWVNAADDPDRCTAILPAVLRRGPISIAVSTSGTAPALASWLRDRIAEVIGPEFEQYAAELAARRSAVHAEGRSTEGLDWYAQIDELAASSRLVGVSS